MNANTSAEVAAALAHLKFWTASLHAQASKAIAAYSLRLSKPLAEWAEQDSNHANLLQQVTYPLVKKDGATNRYCRFPVASIPLSVPQIRAGKPEDVEAACGILNIAGALEKNSAHEIASMAALHLSKPLYQILNLEALAATSAARVQTALEIVDQIETGRFWKSVEPTIWRCLKCGASTKSVQAFEKCGCCDAPQSFATSAKF